MADNKDQEWVYFSTGNKHYVTPLSRADFLKVVNSSDRVHLFQCLENGKQLSDFMYTGENDGDPIVPSGDLDLYYQWIVLNNITNVISPFLGYVQR